MHLADNAFKDESRQSHDLDRQRVNRYLGKGNEGPRRHVLGSLACAAATALGLQVLRVNGQGFTLSPTSGLTLHQPCGPIKPTN